MPLTFTVGALTVQFFPEWIEKRAQIATAAFMTFIAFILVGPSQIIAVPNSLVLMGLGHALGGFASAHAC